MYIYVYILELILLHVTFMSTRHVFGCILTFVLVYWQLPSPVWKGCILLSLFPACPTERVWLSSGPAGCVDHAGHLLSDGPAVVCRRNCPLHLSRQQPEGGVWLLRSGSTASVPGHSGTTGHRGHDICPHGLFCFHDVSAQGEIYKTH